MTAFEEIASKYQEDSDFRFLIIGADQERLSLLRDPAKSWNCFRQIETLHISLDDLESATQAIKRLEPRDYNGCLVLAFDLGPKAVGRCVEEFLGRFRDFRAELPGNQKWDSQVIGFVVAGGDTRISFRSFVNSLADEFAGVGGIDDCLEAVRSWCDPAQSATRSLNLRLACQLQPSWWIRGLKHDYMVKVMRDKWRKSLLKGGYWEHQREIDLWQDGLRNVLVYPDENKSARTTLDEAAKLERRIEKTPCRLVVPDSWSDEFHAVDWQSRTKPPIAGYADPVEARCEIEAGQDAGDACILIWNPSIAAPPSISPRNGNAPHVPIVFVADSVYELSWSSWKRSLTENVLGSFQKAELLDRLPEREPVITTKLLYWKEFCFLSVSNVVDRLIELMVETYVYLEAQSDATVSADGRARLFRAIAQVVCARGLYFA